MQCSFEKATRFSANERINVMNDKTIGLDQTEEEILTYKVSDEALETTAGTGNWKAEAHTMAFCTDLST
jgi:hypothetical protein